MVEIAEEGCLAVKGDLPNPGEKDKGKFPNDPTDFSMHFVTVKRLTVYIP